MKTDNSYTVAIFGIPEFERELVERIFALSASREKVYMLVATEQDNQADIALLDKSNASAVTKFEQFSRKRHHVPTVVVENGHTPKSAYWVKRPFTAVRMLGMLDRLVSNELGDTSFPRVAPDPGNAGSVVRNEFDTAAPGADIYSALVVDDSLPVRKQIGVALRRAGIGAAFAETGETALELIGSNHYDIVFLDVVLPGADGYEICKSIKRDKHKKHIPVVMLTGKSSPFDKVKGRLSGCDSYLTKPVSLKEFNRTLNKWLNPPLTFESMVDTT